MLDAICGEIRNYFDISRYAGTFTVKNGGISPSGFLLDGQYFRIVGSVFNDGVYKYPCSTLTDEIFDGEVWAMAIPPALIALTEKIKAYAESDAAKPSPYVSESFGGYTYTKAGRGEQGGDSSWQSVFGNELNRWRKI